eukprot:2003873-Pleurochrysis_carterae.AAC.1
MHVEEVKREYVVDVEANLPDPRPSGSYGTTPSRAASADAFAARGLLGTPDIQHASAPASPSKSGVYV